MLTFGSLFAGIGGFDLGLERAGMRCGWQVEINPYAQAVLRKHWPHARRHGDVTTFPPPGDWLVDLICGGFPCQDISVAGRGAGLAGARSGLWSEFARIIRQVRPKWVIVENVRAFTSRGIDTVLGQMANIGYDAEWHCVPASSVGAPHRRERIWIVAHARSDGRQGRGQDGATEGSLGLCRGARGDKVACLPIAASDWWVVEPNVGRVAHGVPARVDRLRCLGNAVVPQIVEQIGRAIIAAELEERGQP